MFSSFKKKLKGAINKFSEAVSGKKKEEEIQEELQEELQEEQQDPEKLAPPTPTKEAAKESKKKEKKEKKSEEKEETKEEKKKKTKEDVEEKKEKPAKKEKKAEKQEKKEIKKSEQNELSATPTIKTDTKEETKEKKAETKEQKKAQTSAIAEKDADVQEQKEKDLQTKQEDTEDTKEDLRTKEKPKKKGFFSRVVGSITTVELNEEKFEELFFELEMVMLENNVALEVIDKLKSDLKEDLVGQKMPKSELQDKVLSTLRSSLLSILEMEPIDIVQRAKEKRPYVVALFGINGTGKTTTIAKLTKKLLDEKKSVVLAAADTFRAAAIDQLEIHANKLGVKIIKHDYNADPAAVAFDAIEHAKAKHIDVVLIDTSGRMHSNKNLIGELQKIVRVAKPDLRVFIGESITGNDCIEQAQSFNDAVGIDGIILSKADIDEKGGTSLSIGYVLKKPIIYLGVGQEYEDLKVFNAEELVEQLGL